MVQPHEGLQEPPKREKQKQASRVSLMEELVHLYVLDIRETKISVHQIGRLVWLKCLQVSISNFGVGNHMQKQWGSVSRFVSLEEFSIDVHSSKELWEEVAEAIAEEVATLNKLTSLQFCFPQVECLKLFVIKAQCGRCPALHFNSPLVTTTQPTHKFLTLLIIRGSTV